MSRRHSLSGRLILLFLVTAVLIAVTFRTGFRYGIQDQLRSLAEPHLLEYLEHLKTQLGDPPDRVAARGKVVKFNANILGTNWLHIQDGSGSAADASNDLLVTTAAEADIGDTVVVTGNIALDKDFGAGYSYPVLMEDASVTVE